MNINISTQEEQEDAPNNDAELLNCIQECRMFRIGKRAFKTRYGAIRHLAKMLLLDEINEKVKERMKEDGIFIHSNQMKDVIQKKIFQETYPNYAYADNGTTSAFSSAVTKKAKELMQKEQEKRQGEK